MLELILIVTILALDQITKHIAELRLSPVGTTVPLIPGVFHFTSTHNTGAAWGMLPGFRWLFLPMTLIVCALLVYIMIRHRKRLSVFSRVILALLFAGAVGNAIDRAALSYVRDFLDFRLINFPIFNVADSSLSIGCVLLIFDALFCKRRSLFETVLAEKKPGSDSVPGDASYHG